MRALALLILIPVLTNTQGAGKQPTRVKLIVGTPQETEVIFRQLAQHAKDNIYVSAVYDDQETKITGFRSVVPAHAALNNLVAFFGDVDIRKINEKKLTEYQVARLTGTNKESQEG